MPKTQQYSYAGVLMSNLSVTVTEIYIQDSYSWFGFNPSNPKTSVYFIENFP